MCLVYSGHGGESPRVDLGALEEKHALVYWPVEAIDGLVIQR